MVIIEISPGQSVVEALRKANIVLIERNPSRRPINSDLLEIHFSKGSPYVAPLCSQYNWEAEELEDSIRVIPPTSDGTYASSVTEEKLQPFFETRGHEVKTSLLLFF